MEALHRATINHRVEWTSNYPERPAAHDIYSLSLTRGTVEIQNRDGDGLPPFVLTIRGEQGQIVDEVRTSGADQIDLKIAELFDLVANRSRNSDEVIDSLIDDLDRPF
ncbi:hypothetical protein [Streptomyces sp. NPDC048188]|uniref:hypothetical protein n=1 Tax=Streptomyces sp. NPDC048188 TaxID=3155749 RepID=UPI00344089BC